MKSIWRSTRPFSLPRATATGSGSKRIVDAGHFILSFELLYPSPAEFERPGERIMKRLSGELFWCHVSGRALDPKQPHAAGIWSFEDLSAQPKLSTVLTRAGAKSRRC